MRMSQVIVPVSSVPASLDFYGRVLGVEVLFQQDQYAALDAGGVKLALAGRDERGGEAERHPRSRWSRSTP